MDWGDHCLLECGAMYISGLSFATLEAGQGNGKQSHNSQSRSVDGYKVFGRT
jgi:hypothetical protein